MRAGRKTIMALVVLSLLMLSGCWDRIELEDVAWIQAMGFDKGPSGFIQTTFQIANPRATRAAAAGAGGNGSSKYTTITVASKTTFDALDVASGVIGRRLSIMHCQLFLFSDELARGDLRAQIGAIDRYREVRGTAFVAVSKGRAEDVLRALSSPLEVSPSRFILGVMDEHTRYSGLIEHTFLASFVEDMVSEANWPTCPLVSIGNAYHKQFSEEQNKAQATPTPGGEPVNPVPKVSERIQSPGLPEGAEKAPISGTSFEAGDIPRIGGSPVDFQGLAVFRGGKMVGIFTGDDATAMLMLNNELRRTSVSVPDPLAPEPQYAFGVDLRNDGTKVRVKRNGDRVEIDVLARLSVGYISMKTQTDYSDPRNTPLAEQAIADHVKGMLDLAIQKAQKEYRSDVFGFGTHVRKTFLTWQPWQSFAWQSKFPDAIIRTSVKVDLARYGLSLAPPTVPWSERIGPR